jgi:hypothetical protein
MVATFLRSALLSFRPAETFMVVFIVATLLCPPIYFISDLLNLLRSYLLLPRYFPLFYFVSDLLKFLRSYSFLPRYFPLFYFTSDPLKLLQLHQGLACPPCGFALFHIFLSRPQAFNLFLPAP